MSGDGEKQKPKLTFGSLKIGDVYTVPFHKGMGPWVKVGPRTAVSAYELDHDQTPIGNEPRRQPEVPSLPVERVGHRDDVERTAKWRSSR